MTTMSCSRLKAKVCFVSLVWVRAICTPYEWWTRHGQNIVGVPSEGIGAELGVYDTLLSVWKGDNDFFEYGVVEHLCATAEPSTYRELVRRYRHTAHGPSKYTASAFLASALGLLAREGLLTYRSCRATGYWQYNGRVFAWASPSTAKDRPLTTWADFAQASGHDPGDWPALNYIHGGGSLPWPG